MNVHFCSTYRWRLCVGTPGLGLCWLVRRYQGLFKIISDQVENLGGWDFELYQDLYARPLPTHDVASSCDRK